MAGETGAVRCTHLATYAVNTHAVPVAIPCSAVIGLSTLHSAPERGDGDEPDEGKGEVLADLAHVDRQVPAAEQAQHEAERTGDGVAACVLAKQQRLDAGKHPAQRGSRATDSARQVVSKVIQVLAVQPSHTQAALPSPSRPQFPSPRPPAAPVDAVERQHVAQQVLHVAVQRAGQQRALVLAFQVHHICRGWVSQSQEAMQLSP